MGIKLYYFDFTGRAEAIRLVLTAGKVEFEDVRVPRPEWPELKKKMPFGQLPAIEVDGTVIAQTGALLTYAGRIAGLCPEDPLEAALADQSVCFVEDIWELFRPTWSIQDEDEKIQARQKIMAGPLKEKFGMLTNLIEGRQYLAGDKLSYGDLSTFCFLCLMQSGFLDGVPTNLLDDYPVLKEYRNRIASLDFVKERYAETEHTPYKPDP